MKETGKSSAPKKSLRIQVFASFFKSYMSVSTIVVASIPIPVATWKLIPIYAQQRGFLTVYASLFCFLLLAFVFSIRHRLAPLIFSRGWRGSVIAALPFVFILLTLVCILAYHAVLQHSVQQIRLRGVTATTNDILNKLDLTEIPHELILAGYYLGIFVFAEAAFVLMALREYLQDVLHIDERDLLHGSSTFEVPTPPASVTKAPSTLIPTDSKTPEF